MSTLFDEVASPEAPGDGQQESENVDARRRQLILLGGVVGVAVLAAAGYFVVVPALSGGSNDSNNSVVVPPVHHTTPAAKPSASAKPKTTPTSVPTIQSALDVGRDPFAPLVVAPAGAASPSAGSTPNTDGSSTSGTSTGGSTGGTTGATPTPSVSTVSSTGTLVLKRIYTQDGLWHVDTTWNGQSFSSVLGGDFAGIFSFDSQSGGKTASFTYGGSQHFTLAINGTKKF